ncbi:MAG: hypothetical protein AAB952_01855, partial [Patescibacteria group bacterium]
LIFDMATIIKKHKQDIILDRREALKKSLELATTPGVVVLITGKGTDPFIMGPNDSKVPWSDEEVVREELLYLHRK